MTTRFEFHEGPLHGQVRDKINLPLDGRHRVAVRYSDRLGQVDYIAESVVAEANGDLTVYMVQSKDVRRDP